MSEPVNASMAEVRKHLADVNDNYRRLRESAERYEEEMAALLRSAN